MEITLEKIELVKDRTGISYKEAKEALEANDGSVVDAIIDIEEQIELGTSEGIGGQGAALFGKLKGLVQKGNVSRIVVKRNGETLINVPVSVGVVGALVTPIAMTVGVAAAFGFRCQIEIVKDDGTVVDVSDRVSEATDGAVEKGAAIIDGVKAKGTGYYETIRDKVAEQNYDEKFEGLIDRAKDVGDAVTDWAKESSFEDVRENVADRYHDFTDAAKARIEAVKKDEDFSFRFSEDFENVSEAIEEEIAEELSGIKVIDFKED